MQTDKHLSVIALHGLALSEEEVQQTANPVMEFLGAPGVRWVFPRAPRRPVTVLGCEALAWYDVSTYDRSCLDVDGIEDATDAIVKQVRAERASDPYGGRIVLMGFSQGGALALNAGLRLKDEIDGIVALATAVPFPDRIGEAPNKSFPVFLGHGLFDPKVSYTLGRETHQILDSLGYETEWHSYLCGHTITRRELHNVSDWMRRHFLGDDAPAVQTSPGLGEAYRLSN
jgi:phospholipase/carboxylesterase